jgi:hypothetical protein
MKTRLPGTRLSIEPPDGFVPVPCRPILEVPGGAATMVATERLRWTGHELEDSSQSTPSLGRITKLEDLRIAGREAQLVVTQLELGAPTQQWVATFGNEWMRVQIFVRLAERLAGALAEPMHRALVGVEWAENETGEPCSGLPFTLDHGACGLPLAHSAGAIGTGFQEHAPDAPAPGGGPCGARFVAELYRGGNRMFLLKGPSEASIRWSTKLERSEPFSITLDPFHSLRGWEITANAPRLDGQPLLVYRAFVRLHEGDAMLTGSATLARRDEWLPAFERLARTLRPKVRGTGALVPERG